MKAKTRRRARGSIRYRSDGRWEVRCIIGVKSDGTAHRKSKYFRSREDARAWLKESTAELALGTYYDASSIRLWQWYKQCLNTYGDSLSGYTFRGYDSIFRTHIQSSSLGGMRLSEMRNIHIQAWIGSMEGSPKSIRNRYTALRWCLRKAIANSLIATDPARGVKLPQPAKPIRRVLTAQAAAELLAKAEGHQDYTAWCFAITTGVRVSELLGLCWDSLDLKTGQYTIRREVNQDTDKSFVLADRVKTVSGYRSGYIPESVLAQLRTHRKEQLQRRLEVGDLWQEHGLVFPDSLGEIQPPNTFSTRWRRFQKKHGVEKPAGIHAFRRLFVTSMLSKGAQAWTVATVVGHADANYTRKGYTDVYENDIRDAIPSMAEELLPK